MTTGAFRDATASLERALVLEEENAALRLDLARLANRRRAAETLAALRRENVRLRAIARSESDETYVRALQADHDARALELATLETKIVEVSHRANTRRRPMNLGAIIGIGPWSTTLDNHLASVIGGVAFFLGLIVGAVSR